MTHIVLPGSTDTLLDRSALIDGRDRMPAIVVDSFVRRKEEKSIPARIGGETVGIETQKALN